MATKRGSATASTPARPRTRTARKAVGEPARASITTRARRRVGADAAASERLIPEAGTVVVRMYRIGHGDCFLLAFPGRSATQPVYVLIDCGYKPGSPGKIVADPQITPKAVAASIRAATGGHIDVAVITHEHQDHVNAITESHFAGVTVGETWLAWTEDPNDALANDLRRKFRDRLLGLLAAHGRLAAAGDPEAMRTADEVRELLEFEFGVDEPEAADDACACFDPATTLAALRADGGAGVSSNKKAIRLLKERAEHGVRYIRPHEGVLALPDVKDVRVFALGPPRDARLLASLQPEGDEEFHFSLAGARTAGGYFAAAALAAEPGVPRTHPFANRYRMPWNPPAAPALGAWTSGAAMDHLVRFYGSAGDPDRPGAKPLEVPENAAWRRIDTDWLHAAGQLALDMNDQTNNSSLVLAFELGKGGKVLLFAADAQRGNWVSWAQKEWKDGTSAISARDLLARTVLYKVGHHGSHNATLNGSADDESANLSWMAQGEHAREFTAMITAVRSWAETQKGWDHPLKAIKDALLQKAGGRVFLTDTDVSAMAATAGSSAAAWKAFKSRTRAEDGGLYFDYTVTM